MSRLKPRTHKVDAVDVPCAWYTSLLDVYSHTHLYSSTMSCVNALSLQGNGVFSAYDCHLGTSYPYADCLIACMYFVDLGLLRVVYNAGTKQAMCTFKRTQCVVLHVKNKPIRRPQKINSAQELHAWIERNKDICFNRTEE